MESLAIVEFTADRSVAVVATNWLSEQNDVCYWPPVLKSNVLEKLLKERKAPLAYWATFSVRVME